MKIKAFLKTLKEHRLITFLFVNILMCSTALIIGTVAWFSNAQQIEPALTSAVVTSYFESGTGTQADPYVIYRPVQYYNLVHLQETNPNGFSTNTTYFELGKQVNGAYCFANYGDDGVEATGTSQYLNMTHYQDKNDGKRTIRPLGNDTYPFIGHIEGNGLTIQNLTVFGYGQADIGIFGLVGQGALINNVYFDNVEIDVSSADLTNAHAHNDHANIGHIAGHTVDAKSSFTNVYTSNCEIVNTETSTVLKSSRFGDYGMNDAITSTKAGEDNNYSINPSSIHSYLEDNYADYSAQNLKTRNTEYAGNEGSATISTALGHTTSDYTMNAASNRNYSLSTVGYTSDDTQMYYRYFDNTAYRRFPTSTRETSVPYTEQTEAGSFVYYDTQNSKWIYYSTKTGESTTQQVTFNCYTISYEYKATSSSTTSTRYWLYYNNGSLGITSTAPNLSTESDIANSADYLWVFKDTESSVGLSSITNENNGVQLVKIYSPNNQKYLTSGLTSSSSYSTPTFTDSYSDATMFKISGPNSTISFEYNSSGGDYSFVRRFTLISGGVHQYSTNHVLAGERVGNYESIEFQFKTTDDKWIVNESQNKPLQLVTDTNELSVGSKIAVVINCINTSLKTNEYRAMSAQSGTRRGAYVVSVDENNQITADLSNINLFELGMDGEYFTLKEQDSTVYLTADTSGNYLKTTTAISDTSRWAITIGDYSSDTKMAKIKSNTTNNYTIAYNSQQNWFSCYKLTNISTSNSSGGTTFLPYIFKEVEGSSSSTESHSIQFTHEATTSATIQLDQLYDTYAAKMNEGTTNYTLFTIAKSENTTVVFDFNNSKVSVKRVEPEAWRLVTDVNTLASNDLVIFVQNDGTKALSTAAAANSNYRGAVDIVKDNNTKTISFDDNVSVAKFKITKSGSTFTFYDTTNNKYLQSSNSTSSTKKNYLTLATSAASNSANWNISIDNSTGSASVYSNYTSTNYLHYYTYSSYFRSHTSSNIQIYKYYPEQLIDRSERYISDEIENGYDPSQIDIVGNATFNADSVTIPARTTSSYYYGNVTVGNTFYTTAYCPNSIVLYIPKTGSLDLGTINIQYSSGTPQFSPTSGTSGVSFASLSETDNDGNVDFSLNMYNIDSIAMCGLDDSNQIVATRDDLSNTAITKYVVCITSSSGNLSITSLDYEFLSLEGNTGDHGASGYMEASYNADGTLNTSNSRLEGTILNFYYDVPQNETVDVSVIFDKATSTYTVTFTSSVAMDVNFFNYNAEKYHLVVNGTAYTRGAQVVHITA